MTRSWRWTGGAVALAVLMAHAAASGCGDVNGDVIVRSTAGDRCSGDADCSGDGLRCDVAAGSCVVCLVADDCPAGQICVLPANACVPSCRGTAVCAGAQPVCDSTSGACRGCAGDDECPDGTRCQSSGACVACLGMADCDAGSEAPFCDVASGRCVECLEDGHCDDIGETCSRVLGECAVPCSATRPCGTDDPICDYDIGYCVECQTDAQCDDDELCRGSACVGGDGDQNQNQQEDD